jgi:argininosuccinate synthase
MNKKLLLAFSGGLDTSYCAKALSQEDYEVETVTVNTGGFDVKEMEQIEAYAYDLGVKKHHKIDATNDFYERCIRFLIAGNVLRNNTYPLCVSAERAFQAWETAVLGKKLGVGALAHGCTGAGNDQVRFDMIFNTVYPEAEIISPVRDRKLAREESIQYLKDSGVNRDWTKHLYSINKGLWGTSVGGKETLTSDGFLPEEAFPHPMTATESQKITIGFDCGEPVSIDGRRFEHPAMMISALSDLVGPFGIGRDIHVGDTIIGLKGRVGFEAGGPLVILRAHETLEKHVLTKSQMAIKSNLAQTYGAMIHEGFAMEPVLRDIEQFFMSSQRKVSGEVDVLLSPYRYQVLGIRSPNDLMRSQFGVYGEMNKMWSGEEAKAFAKILGNSLNIYYQVNGHES